MQSRWDIVHFGETMSMDEDEDIFSAPSASSGSAPSGDKSLFRVLNVNESDPANTKVKGEQEALESAAKLRIEKQNLENHRRAQNQSQQDKRRGGLYDERDDAKYDDDVDNVIDITTMGVDLSGSRRSGAKKGEYADILPEERIEPLNMNDEMRRGEVNLYGEMRRKKRRTEDEEDPTELAVPSANGEPVSSKKKKRKAKQKQHRLGTGDSSESDESSDDGDGIDDDDENEVLNAEDPWLAAVSKQGESGVYNSKSSKLSRGSKAPSAAPAEYLRDTPTALQEILVLLQEGPSGETVLRMIKRLTPPDSNRHKKAKSASNSVPTNTTEEHLDQEAVEAKKLKFSKVVALADYLMDSGFTTVYESTYDAISNRLNPKSGRKTAIEDEAKEIVQGQDSTFWQYKWTLEDPNIYGPFESESMKSWVPSFAQFQSMVVRGCESPSALSKMAPDEAWIPFEPLLWS